MNTRLRLIGVVGHCLDPFRFRYGSINSIDVKFKELIQDTSSSARWLSILALR